MEETDGVLLVVVRPETVRADELGKVVGAMRVGAFDAAHLVDDDGGTSLGGLPCGFRTSEAPADDMNGFV
ncbi:hypothetical protein D3C71_2129220 [compost metagenome]